ncbi:MAG: hypothetical protein ACREMB_16730 [Candidatus Rokuibacteriota bacterium]
MAAEEPVRMVRIPEHVFLARPDLWSQEGLEDYLREQGIDPSRPYERQDIYIQDAADNEALAA